VVSAAGSAKVVRTQARCAAAPSAPLAGWRRADEQRGDPPCGALGRELDWLEDELAERADAEGPEEEGPVQAYYVAGQSATRVRTLLVQILEDRAETDYRVSVQRGDVVIAAVGTRQWIKYPASMGSAYESVLKRKFKEISADPQWTAWWSVAPYDTLYVQFMSPDIPRWSFREHEGSLLVQAHFGDELAIVDEESPDKSRMRDMAARQTAEILDRTAEWLKAQPPT
jgi:hypothetical protein